MLKIIPAHTKVSVTEVALKRNYIRQNGGRNMSNLSEVELQNLRHLIGGFETSHCKLQEYATEAQNPEIKQFFAKGAKSAMENKQQLMKFLN